MKQLIVAILAVFILTGCGDKKSKFVGYYEIEIGDEHIVFELKTNGHLENAELINGKLSWDDTGTWNIKGENLEFVFPEEDLKVMFALNSLMIKDLIKFGESRIEEIKEKNGGDIFLRKAEDGKYDSKKINPLTQCVTCNGKVSKNANASPHCGEPNPVKN